MPWLLNAVVFWFLLLYPRITLQSTTDLALSLSGQLAVFLLTLTGVSSKFMFTFYSFRSVYKGVDMRNLGD